MNCWGQILCCIVDGLFVLDNVISVEVVCIKNIESLVVGDVDVLVVFDIEVGNILYKMLLDLGGVKGVGFVFGVVVFIVLMSCLDNVEIKLVSIVFVVFVFVNWGSINL